MVAAVEEGNLPGLEKLFSVAQNIDVNMTNKVSCFLKTLLNHSKLTLKRRYSYI